jgi:hypothetical protein
MNPTRATGPPNPNVPRYKKYFTSWARLARAVVAAADGDDDIADLPA